MVPTTSSPSSILTRIGVEFSINRLRYRSENEKVGLPLAGQADERLVVVLDGANHFLSVFHFDADRRRILDQPLEILGLFKRLFRRARGFSWRWRSGWS